MSEVLKPCPFCGGQALPKELDWGWPATHGECQKCGCSATLDMWNTRPAGEVAAMVERLQEVHSFLTSDDPDPDYPLFAGTKLTPGDFLRIINLLTRLSRSQGAGDAGFWRGLDHIANFINALDTSDMDAKAIRSAIYSECLTARPSLQGAGVDREAIARVREGAAGICDEIARIGHASPFWDKNQALMFEDAAARIRAIPIADVELLAPDEDTIAGIIDPEAFSAVGCTILKERLGRGPRDRDAALVKARHILALFSAAAQGDGWEPLPDDDLARECLTPETYYEVSWGNDGFDFPRILRVKLRFPFNIEDWIDGNSAIEDMPEGADPDSDVERLRRYDARAAERKRITDLIHDQMEPVGVDAYRVLREVDQRIGRDRVEYGIRHARWRRTKEGERPSPQHPLPAPPTKGEGK